MSRSYVLAVEAIMRRFPKKIKVTLINAESGERIGECKMIEAQLPAKFKRPIIVNIMGRRWRVLDAEPRKAIDFIFTRKLVLKVIDPELPNRNNRFYYPTVADGLPESEENSLFNEFIIERHMEDWRQIEFLPTSMLHVVEREISKINSILNVDDSPDLLLGYERNRVRKKIGALSNNIPFDEFCERINVLQKGAVKILGNDDEFVKDGIAIRSPNYEYYGIVENGIIKSLCLKEFDCADDELLDALSAFGLVLVIWCEAKIFSGEMKDSDGSENDSFGTGQVSDAAIM